MKRDARPFGNAPGGPSGLSLGFQPPPVKKRNRNLTGTRSLRGSFELRSQPRPGLGPMVPQWFNDAASRPRETTNCNFPVKSGVSVITGIPENAPHNRSEY